MKQFRAEVVNILYELGIRGEALIGAEEALAKEAGAAMSRHAENVTLEDRMALAEIRRADALDEVKI